jgi:ABC-2 type transport system permease protein
MRLSTVWRLGIKELWSLLRTPALLLLIAAVFSIQIYAAAVATPFTLNRAPISIVDEDASPLSARIASAFYQPYFDPPQSITLSQMNRRMDEGIDTFALVIPPNFQRDLLAGSAPAMQLNVDATRMTQAFAGAGYVQAIVSGEVAEFTQRYRATETAPVELVLRARFNSELNPGWFSAMMEVVNNVALLSVILAGATLIRERERGTIEHLLVMPVRPVEIMLGKIWPMALVVLGAALFALTVVVQTWLAIPMAGSLWLLMFGMALQLFATTSLGIFLATIAGSMPQFGLLLMPRAVSASNPRWRADAGREHASGAAPSHVARARYAFRCALAIDHVPRRRARRCLAAARKPCRHRSCLVFVLSLALPQIAAIAM